MSEPSELALFHQRASSLTDISRSIVSFSRQTSREFSASIQSVELDDPSDLGRRGRMRYLIVINVSWATLIWPNSFWWHYRSVDLPAIDLGQEVADPGVDHLGVLLEEPMSSLRMDEQAGMRDP